MNDAMPHKLGLGAVFVVAALQVVGYAIGSETLRGIGLWSAASPLPFVFSSHKGVETFSPRFAVIFEEDDDGRTKQSRVDVDVSLYGRLAGSYNRRNTYGVIFSHGPILEQNPAAAAMIDAVARYAFCAGGSLQHAFQTDYRPRRVVLESRLVHPATEVWRRAVDCEVAP